MSSGSLPALGYLGDRFSRDGVFVTTAAGLRMFVLGSGPIALTIVVLLVGVGFSWGGVLQSRVIAALPEGEEKHGFGLVRAAYMLIGSAGSVTTGALADQIRWA